MTWHPSNESMRLIEAAFSDQFIAYVLNLDPESAECSELEDSISEEVARVVRILLRQHRRVGREFFTRIGSVGRGQNTTLANQWRLQCGGELPEGPFLEDDPLGDSLSKVIRDLFPAMMLAVHQGGLGNEAVSLRDAVRSQKPALDKFMSTIPTDDLRFLLDPSGVNLERRSTVLWSSGHKQSIELEQLPIDMVLAVVERMRLLGEYERISLSQAIANPEAGTR